MPNLKKWSQSASGNAAVTGGVNTINWTEGQAPSTVNNSAREMMAQVRRVYRPDEWGWVECSATASVASQTTFKLTGDQTSDYTASRRVRLTGGSVAMFGTIVSASFTSETTVTITRDSGSLSASMSIAALSAVYDKNSGTQITAASNMSWTGTHGFGASASFSAAVSVGGPFFASASVSMAGAIAFSGDITPAQITANQDNYAPTGYATCAAMRLDTDASRNITGIQGGADGRLLWVYNVGSNNINLINDSTSTAANRFLTPNGTTVGLVGGAGVQLLYDSTSSRWRIVAFAQGRGTQADMEAATSNSVNVTPGFQQNHPGHPKFWAYVTVSAGTPTLQTSYNVTSITDTGAGQLTVTIATDFSSANWCCQATTGDTNAGAATAAHVSVDSDLQTAGVVGLVNWVGSDPETAGDPVSWHVMGLGDQ